MPQSFSPAALSSRIQKLVAEQKRHVDALARIEPALEEIRAALGIASTVAPVGKTAAPAGKPGRKSSRRGRYAVTGAQSILDLVQQKGNPTTQDIRKLWSSDKRGGSADNVLSQLVKTKKLKRTPLVNQRGSRYSLP